LFLVIEILRLDAAVVLEAGELLLSAANAATKNIVRGSRVWLKNLVLPFSMYNLSVLRGSVVIKVPKTSSPRRHGEH